MKSVLISIQPKWCELIAADIKTEELRKSKPKLDLPFKCYIYQTKHKWLYDLLVRFDRWRTAQILADGLCKVIGEFICDEIKPVHFNSLEKETICQLAVGNGNAEWYKGSCVSYKEAYRYLKGSKKAYAWHISGLKIYDKPKMLSEFIVASKYGCCNEGVCRGCPHFEKGNGIDIEDDCLADFDTDAYKPLRRPPQSWCYVEGN